MDGQQDSHGPPVAENLRQVTDGLSKLVKEHIELARVEAIESLKKGGRDLVLTGIGAGFLLLSWLLGMFAAGYGIGSALGDGWGFLIIAGFHVVVGVPLVAVYAKRLQGQDKPNLRNTTLEIEHDKHFLHRIREIVREQPTPPGLIH